MLLHADSRSLRAEPNIVALDFSDYFLLEDVRLDSDRKDRGIKRICIIGAGAAGLTALKVIMDREEYKCGNWKPVVYEAREDIGGIWSVRTPSHYPLFEQSLTFV